MYPYLFGIESPFFDMYTILIIVGILAAVVLFKFLNKRFATADKVYNFYSLLGLVAIGAGLVCSFLFQQVYNLIESARDGTKYEPVGVTFYGGLIGGVLTFILGTLFFAKPDVKKEFWSVANLAAPCIVIGHAFGRYGCYCAGCCYGKPVAANHFGIAFPQAGRRVIPTNLYEALFLTALAAAMLILLLRSKKTDPQLLVYAFAYAIFRFIIEFYRGDDRGVLIPGLSPSQWWSIAIFLTASALAFYVYYLKRVPFSGRADRPNSP
ncbi:MAG: prolipoprotein diacylglyceryl transferase [Clostridiales bacterium]|jgi:phosphatidylglycerol:prolipoprotein diacylglycerol transferase|nr:prolipoprotein diacylglyceryl transferase [Clostridiales bacterium]